MTLDEQEDEGIRLAEVVGCLAVATDLATGQPLEHSLRRTLLAVWLGQELGLDVADLGSVYYVALLGSVGCILDGAAFAEFVGDEIAIREQMATLDPSRRLEVAAFFLRRVGAGRGPVRRLRNLVSLSRQSRSVCRDVASQVGRLLDLGPAIGDALGQCEEHWNGGSPVLGLRGEEIHIAARLFLLCHDVEVFNRVGGPDAALAVVRRRAGVLYDPRIAEGFCNVGVGLLARLQVAPAWDSVLAVEPQPAWLLQSSGFDDVATKIANFVDVRSPYTVGHSPAVANLAERAGRAVGLQGGEVSSLRRAGLLHDLGRAGVPVSIWNTTGPLTTDEWTRIKRHPPLTELVLARSSALGHLGTLAGLHHERLDGSGYRGVAEASLPLTARILAAADSYQTKLEPRPHREAMRPDAAATHLSGLARQGLLDRRAVDAVLGVAEQPIAPPRGGPPAGLSERELEVLRQAARGLSNREIAGVLVLSPKTVGHHIENIYKKIGVSTRVGATLFAVQHGLIQDG